MSYQQGQPQQWPQQSGQPPTGYPPNQGWGSPQQPLPRQQPNTQYAPQWTPPQVPPQYYQQFQQPPPKKKSKAWLWIVLGVAALLVCSCIGFAAVSASQQQNTSITSPVDTSSASNPTSAPTQAPAQGTWTPTHTFTGNGTKKTEIFTVSNDWKILYTCTFQDIGGVTADGALALTVYGADNSIIDPAAVDATCKQGVAMTKGETEEHQGGQVYLSITGTGDWTITIQELK
jgi:hypothetical protein